MDEKGFLLGKLHKTKRIVSKYQLDKGYLTGSGQDGNREWITLLACICMDGTHLPPAIIYQAQTGNLQDSWLDDYDPESQCAFFASSPNGWTNDKLGFHWLTRVFDVNTKLKARHARDPRLLFIDGHGSHINMKFLTWCEKNNVHVALYPPHSTHRLQPLDVSLFSPLANFYSQNLDNWILETSGLSSMSKREFWKLFYPAFKAAFSEENIESGFRKTGLRPLDAEAVLQSMKQRPVSSSSSTKSNLSLRKIRRAARQGALQGTTEALANSLLPQLMDRADRAETEVTLLKTRLAAAEATIKLEKKRRKRGKPLFDNLFEIAQGEPIFFSPTKIAAARQRQEDLERAEQAATALKVESKIQKQLLKEAKQQHAAEKKAARQQEKIDREATRKEEGRAKEAAKQRQKEAKEALKLRARNTQLASKEPANAHLAHQECVVDISSDNGAGSSTAATRPRRNVRLPKHLQGDNIVLEPFA